MSKKLVEVKGHPDFKMDMKSGAVINTNKQEINLARERKRRLKEKDEKFQKLQDEVDQMKSLLEELVRNQNGSNRTNN